MSNTHNINSVSATLPNTLAWVKMLNGSGRRFALIFTSTSGLAFAMNNGNAAAGSPGLIQVGSGQLSVMKYRDFGMMIQGEVWCRSNSGSIAVTVTELYYTG